MDDNDGPDFGDVYCWVADFIEATVEETDGRFTKYDVVYTMLYYLRETLGDDGHREVANRLDPVIDGLNTLKVERHWRRLDESAFWRADAPGGNA